jgi:hypothetical protein
MLWGNETDIGKVGQEGRQQVTKVICICGNKATEVVEREMTG